jgi:hypothetical protein
MQKGQRSGHFAFKDIKIKTARFFPFFFFMGVQARIGKLAARKGLYSLTSYFRVESG